MFEFAGSGAASGEESGEESSGEESGLIPVEQPATTTLPVTTSTAQIIQESTTESRKILTRSNQCLNLQVSVQLRASFRERSRPEKRAV